MFIHLVEGVAQQVARFQVDLVDGVFQRLHGLQQIGILGIQKGLAFARRTQLVQRRQVDGAQGVDLALDAVDLGLQAPQLHATFFDAALERLAVHLGGLELVEVLRTAQLRGLEFQLQRGDAVAQRLQAALEAHALLVGRAHLGAEIVVLAARRTQVLLAFELERQRRLQARLRRGIVEAGEFFLQLTAGLLVGRHLGRGRLHAALQLALACGQAARLELRLLGLAFQAALLLAGVGQAALGGDDDVVQLGVTFLGGTEVDVE